MPVVLERGGEDVDLLWWRGWRCLGERERRWRGLGVEDGYGRRGEREGEVDMGRRWRARWRPGQATGTGDLSARSPKGQLNTKLAESHET